MNKNLQIYKKYNLPSYNHKTINKNVFITYGKDNSGDINNIDNIDYIQELLKNENFNKFHIITGDGGFDEGIDFNNKEQLHYNLILSEIYSAIKLQQVNGHFILKVFDIFTETSIHLLYLLSLFYSEIYIYKPKTSRPTNSEKYIICKFFKINNEKYYLNILSNLKILSKKIYNNDCIYTSFKIFKYIPESFIINIKNINECIINQQCHHLHEAIILCNDHKFIKNYDILLHNTFKNRKSTYEEWCRDYNY